ncbi:MAG: PIG-L deacetylase family protein [Myxococcota bacterium]|nr:PIG-L deacetylase family protein [Myxococcota bacterium]
MREVAVVVAHPDDETYPFAGTIARLSDAGVRVRVVCATRGEGGWDLSGRALSGEALGAERVRELTRSCEQLGAAPPIVLGLPDGGVEPDPAPLRDALASAAPDLLLTLDTDGAYGHVDHLAVTEMVRRAAGDTPVLHAVFPPELFEPFRALMARHAPGALGLPAGAPLGREGHDLEVDVRGARDRKLAAIAAHRTQVRAGDPRRFLFDGLVDALLDVERFRWASEARVREWPL